MVFALFLSCSSDEDPKSTTGLELNLDQELVLKLANEYRQQGAVCGASEQAPAAALIWSDELAKAALDHSNDMQQNDYFSHNSLDGSTFSERTVAAGFDGSPVGENIAKGYSSEASLMQGWMESEGHCTNIMNSQATHIGVARSDEEALWTMVLGRK